LGKGRDRMWNRLKIVLVITAMCTGISIIFLEAVFIGSGMWSVRLAARREPVDLFSGSCDVSQLEEMDVVCGTIYELCGRYDYTYDDYVSDIAYYYVLPIDTAGTVCYMGIRETKGRKSLFRKLSVKTAFDVKERGINVKDDASTYTDAQGEPIFVEGFLFRMSERQYNTFQAWLEKAGVDGQALPYYIKEQDIAGLKRAYTRGLLSSMAGVVMVAGSITALIRWRRRSRRQTHISIGDTLYEKSQLTRVNQLIEHVEQMQAVYELSRITGMELPQAERIVRKWYRYWY